MPDVNTIGVKNLCAVANELDIPLIHFSSDYVFDGKKNTPYQETDKPNPLSIYGKQKVSSEEFLMKNLKTGLIIRTAWLFSSYGKDFVKTIYHLALQKDTLNVVFDQTGSPCYGEDLAKAVIEILPRIKNNTCEIYHYTNEGVCTWYDLAYFIVNEFSLKCIVRPVHSFEFSQKAPRPSYSVLDKTKIKQDFNVSIDHYSFALKRCIEKIKRVEKI